MLLSVSERLPLHNDSLLNFSFPYIQFVALSLPIIIFAACLPLVGWQPAFADRFQRCPKVGKLQPLLDGLSTDVGAALFEKVELLADKLFNIQPTTTPQFARGGSLRVLVHTMLAHHIMYYSMMVAKYGLTNYMCAALARNMIEAKLATVEDVSVIAAAWSAKIKSTFISDNLPMTAAPAGPPSSTVASILAGFTAVHSRLNTTEGAASNRMHTVEAQVAKQTIDAEEKGVILNAVVSGMALLLDQVTSLTSQVASLRDTVETLNNKISSNGGINGGGINGGATSSSGGGFTSSSSSSSSSTAGSAPNLLSLSEATTLRPLSTTGGSAFLASVEAATAAVRSAVPAPPLPLRYSLLNLRQALPFKDNPLHNLWSTVICEKRASADDCGLKKGQYNRMLSVINYAKAVATSDEIALLSPSAPTAEAAETPAETTARVKRITATLETRAFARLSYLETLIKPGGKSVCSRAFTVDAYDSRVSAIITGQDKAAALDPNFRLKLSAPAPGWVKPTLVPLLNVNPTSASTAVSSPKAAGGVAVSSAAGVGGKSESASGVGQKRKRVPTKGDVGKEERRVSRLAAGEGAEAAEQARRDIGSVVHAPSGAIYARPPLPAIAAAPPDIRSLLHAAAPGPATAYTFQVRSQPLLPPPPIAGGAGSASGISSSRSSSSSSSSACGMPASSSSSNGGSAGGSSRPSAAPLPLRLLPYIPGKSSAAFRQHDKEVEMADPPPAEAAPAEAAPAGHVAGLLTSLFSIFPFSSN